MPERFDAKRVRRVLLVKLRAIGDAVLTLPSLEGLKRGLPGARVDVLAPQASLPVYEGDARVGRLWAYERRAPLARQAALAQGLQAEGYDLAVCLHASFRSAFLGWLSGAPWRSVRNHSGRDWFCNLPASERKEPKSIIQRDFDALRALGLAPRDERPRMAIPPAALSRARQLAKMLRLGRKGLLFFPGAGKPEKRWPLESFVALAKSLRRKGWRCVLLNAPGEEDLSAAAASAGAAWLQLPDLNLLGALAALTGRALGNDSGPRHIAAASGARTFTLFGPEQLREWHPYKREEGHWALRPDSGRVEDLGFEEVARQCDAWLKKR